MRQNDTEINVKHARVFKNPLREIDRLSRQIINEDIEYLTNKNYKPNLINMPMEHL